VVGGAALVVLTLFAFWLDWRRGPDWRCKECLFIWGRRTPDVGKRGDHDAILAAAYDAQGKPPRKVSVFPLLEALRDAAGMSAQDTRFVAWDYIMRRVRAENPNK